MPCRASILAFSPKRSGNSSVFGVTRYIPSSNSCHPFGACVWNTSPAVAFRMGSQMIFTSETSSRTYFTTCANTSKSLTKPILTTSGRCFRNSTPHCRMISSAGIHRVPSYLSSFWNVSAEQTPSP